MHGQRLRAPDWWGWFAGHDLVAFGYLGIMLALTWGVDGAGREPCMTRILTMALALGTGVLVGRSPSELPEHWRGHIYRAAIAFVVVDGYLMLRDLLPLLRQDAVDMSLIAIDEALFGVTPALWLERFNHRGIIEWFSFFYFSYFWICSGYLTVMLWLLPPDRNTSVFAFGSVIVLFVGQLGYVAVPGFGPVVALADRFAAPLDGGVMWHLVHDTVATAGAQKDIFPSLHTALPTFFTLFAFRCARGDRRWLPVACLTAFFAANIVVSTMLLRWHYAIDVVFGLGLACYAHWIAPRAVSLEEAWRRREGFQSAWIRCRAGHV